MSRKKQNKNSLNILSKPKQKIQRKSDSGKSKTPLKTRKDGINSSSKTPNISSKETYVQEENEKNN